MNPFTDSVRRHRVLVIAAHPDDEVLGCGGTMARHADSGDTVDLVILGEGITARDVRRDRRVREPALKSLRSDLKKSSDILGLNRVAAHDFPDNRFDSIPRLDLIKVIEQQLAISGPSIVYTHHRDDLNIDHRCVADAVQTALRPLPGRAPVAILAFEVASSTEYQSSLTAGAFRPNVYVDISPTLDRKCRAMDAYRTERRSYPHPRSSKAIRVSAAKNGLDVGLEAAERFALVRAVSVSAEPARRGSR